MIRIAILVLLIGIVGCGRGKPQNSAEDYTFYCQIQDDLGTDFSRKLKNHLESTFPLKKYAITNSSGMTWPFYREFELDEAVPKDSLMPPHTYVHVIKKYNEQKIEAHDRMMQVILFPEKNYLPAYSMKLYRRDSSGWKLMAQTGIHAIDSASFNTDNELINQFEKSIIRYSFK